MFNSADDNPEKRKRYWIDLFNHPRVCSHDDMLDSLRALKDEPNLDVRSMALAALTFLERWSSVPAEKMAHSFRDLLWRDFEASNSPSAAVAVCDHDSVPDMLSFFQLGRYLNIDRCPGMNFHMVDRRDPDWSPLALGNLRTICFVSRPAFFKSCGLVDVLPSDRVFELIDDRFGMRGTPVTKRSAEAFHHILMNRLYAGPCKFRAQDTTDGHCTRRHDYAVVQRFVVRYGAKDVAIVVLGGSTSLGTYAATQWATSQQSDNDLFAALGQSTLEPRSLEVLLEVKGMIHSPPRLWDPEEITVKKIYVNGKRMTDRGPCAVTLGLGKNSPLDVRYVLLDDDEVHAPIANVQAALAAVCLKASTCEAGTFLDLAELWSDTSVWPEGISGEMRGLGDPVTFLRETPVKREYLLDKLHVYGDGKMKLDSPVLLVDAAAPQRPSHRRRKSAEEPSPKATQARARRRKSPKD